jgi:hypothetical protein
MTQPNPSPGVDPALRGNIGAFLQEVQDDLGRAEALIEAMKILIDCWEYDGMVGKLADEALKRMYRLNSQVDSVNWPKSLDIEVAQ